MGGFFPLEDVSKPRPHNYITAWHITPENTLAFHNLRSALLHLLTHFQPQKIWLPAYICQAVADAVECSQSELAYYPITVTLSPDVEFLQNAMADGDAVLGVDYFGRPPSDDFLNLVNRRTDIMWIEDCAQAMATGRPPWGDYLLYSPRKLLGVPDGGLLVSRSRALEWPNLRPPETENFLQPYRMRQQDVNEVDNDVWYARFLEEEALMVSGLVEMSEITKNILLSSDPVAHGERRRKNFEVLSVSELKSFALITEWDVNTIPMGFPIGVADPGHVVKQLARRRIFLPRYWPDLPANLLGFDYERSLAASVLLLPVDHRYDETHMQTLISEVMKVLKES